MFAGGLLSWMVLIPLIVTFGQSIVMYPGTLPISEMFASGGASAIWRSYIRYIGAGALATGGIISLIKSLPLIIRTFRDSMASLGAKTTASKLRTEQDLPMSAVLITIAALTLAVWLVPAIPVSLIGAIIVVVFGFFFAAVSSRMVGLVGSSNNPVSGMAIATLLFSTLILKATGESGASGMVAAISIGSIICIVAAISGDTSQDLKTGYLLGSTPKKQQIGEIIGVIASALAIGGTLYLLNAAWTYGSAELPAPQAMLMKMITEGVMNAQLPWNLVAIGAIIAIVIELIKIPVLPFAIGMYLPVHLNACIMVGGVIRWIVEKSKKDSKEKETAVNNGILYCSGMIAGEGLIGILLAVVAIFGWDKFINVGAMLNLPAAVSEWLSVALFAVIILLVFVFSLKKKKANQQ